MSTQDPYENASLVELHFMVANAKPGDVSGKAEALRQAAAALQELGGRVHAKVSGVEWKGEGGDAFRSWSEQFLSSTREFTNYTQTVGHVMGYAGQALHEVQPAVPTPPASAFLCTPDSPPVTKQAAATMESDRQEAITQINKLASTYSQATDELTAAKQSAPRFQPLPGAMVPDEARNFGGYQTQIPATGQDEAPRAASGASSQPEAVANETRSASSSGATGTSRGPGAEGVPQTAPRTTLDSITPVTVAQRSHSTLEPLTPGKLNSGSTRTPFVPDIARLPAPWGDPGVGGRALSTEPLPTVGNGADRASRMPSTAVGDEGIVGGTPSVSRRSLTPRMPRGVVVGEEQSPALRGPVGGGRYAGATGPASGVAGGAPARRLASEPGGELSAPRSGTGSASEYTPGGSGLRRSPEGLTEEGVAGGSSVHPMGSVAGARAGALRDERSRRGTRPDYLVEDDETWASGSRDVVPPVVD